MCVWDSINVFAAAIKQPGPRVPRVSPITKPISLWHPLSPGWWWRWRHYPNGDVSRAQEGKILKCQSNNRVLPTQSLTRWAKIENFECSKIFQDYFVLIIYGGKGEGLAQHHPVVQLWLVELLSYSSSRKVINRKIRDMPERKASLQLDRAQLLRQFAKKPSLPHTHAYYCFY